LDSIFRLNKNTDAWTQEQHEREKFLNEMQAQYGTIGMSSEYASLEMKNHFNAMNTLSG
jgi:hypothetical protein